MTSKVNLRIRFTFNRETGSMESSQTRFRTKAKKYAYTVVEAVGVEFAEGQYETLKSIIRSEISAAVDRELKHITMLYRNFVIGKTRVGRGTLTTAVKGEESNRFGVRQAAQSVPLSKVLPAWAPRSKKYLARKQREKGHTKWFLHSGYLGQQMTPGNWEDWFGPVHVSVQPIKSRKREAGPFTDTIAFSAGTQRFGVARVSVRVFESVTPNMVSALVAGNLVAAQTGDGRTNGLLGLVGANDADAAYRLGGNPEHAPYRPTLEPFLAFVLTRSVPTAVFNRLAVNGFKEKIGSAGRTR